MEWWPGTPHVPHRDPAKVKAIQRSLDWKRVAQIAAYLLQEEITDASDRIEKYFEDVYEPKKFDPGREWPPNVGKIVRFNRSVFPTFSNVLVHVNGASVSHKRSTDGKVQTGKLLIDPKRKDLRVTVVDGQHRVNGGFLALKIKQEKDRSATWDIPAEVFVELDPPGGPPKFQAQLFIDVNLYQKKVDRSLVADLFPTTRSGHEALDDKARAQDIGRRLMLESGPLVGMIQIPGIRYGVKGVVALATLVGAIEDILPVLQASDIDSLELQTDFISQCLNAWLEATGRKETPIPGQQLELDNENVVYQGRILVSVVLALIPAAVSKLKQSKVAIVSDAAADTLAKWMRSLIETAGFLEKGMFIDKTKFKAEGFLGSGGIGRFRDRLWASASLDKNVSRMSDETIAKLADENKAHVLASLKG
jgi:DGQHR domain-containing protein